MLDTRVSQFVGIPFKAKGRDLETGVDCWGLLYHAEKVLFNKTVPSFQNMYSWAMDDIQSLIDQMKPLLAYPQVPEPTPGDIVLLRFQGLHTHVGLYVGDNYMLHSDPWGRGLSCLDRLSSPRIAPRIEGFYRVP